MTKAFNEYNIKENSEAVIVGYVSFNCLTHPLVRSVVSKDGTDYGTQRGYFLTLDDTQIVKSNDVELTKYFVETAYSDDAKSIKNRLQFFKNEPLEKEDDDHKFNCPLIYGQEEQESKPANEVIVPGHAIANGTKVAIVIHTFKPKKGKIGRSFNMIGVKSLAELPQEAVISKDAKSFDGIDLSLERVAF